MSSQSSTLPIGVFDSGLGGLSVLKVLHERFPRENFLYLGDNARIPYGGKSPQMILKFLSLCLNYLVEQKIKAVVIACNSASSVASELNFNLPLYEVIGPGAKKAVATSLNNKIGVMATRATVSKKTYVTEIQKLNPAAQVFQQSCPLLVPLVEEGWDEDPLTNLVVYRYLSPLLSMNIDTLVLGCTHYPILKNAIAKVAGPAVTLVDSGESIADLIEKDFQLNKIPPNHSGLSSEIKIIATDLSEIFQIQAHNIMAKTKIKSFEHIDI